MTKFLTFTLLAVTTLGFSLAQAAVSVRHESGALVLQAQAPVRWEQVLAALPPAGQYAYFSALAKPDELAALEQQRQQVLEQLHNLSQHWYRQGKPQLAYAARELQGQLMGINLIARQPVSFDYDKVRLYPASNPRLHGDYELLLRERPNYVRAYGLVRLPGKRPFVKGGYAYHYGQRLTLLPGAMQRRLWVIQPNGEVVEAHIDPFNPEFVGVAPGATLFVGFAQLPKAFAGLNQHIISLLANQKPE